MVIPDGSVTIRVWFTTKCCLTLLFCGLYVQNSPPQLGSVLPEDRDCRGSSGRAMLPPSTGWPGSLLPLDSSQTRTCLLSDQLSPSPAPPRPHAVGTVTYAAITESPGAGSCHRHLRSPWNSPEEGKQAVVLSSAGHVGSDHDPNALTGQGQGACVEDA